MRRGKLPPEAFAFYLSLGADRSYSAVGKRYGLATKTVARTALKERWQARLDEHERKSREAAERSAVESLEEMQQRHLRLAKAIQVRGLEALRSLQLRTARDAVYAIDVGVRQEREIRLAKTEVDERSDDLAELRRVFQEEMRSGIFDGAVSVNSNWKENPAPPDP